MDRGGLHGWMGGQSSLQSDPSLSLSLSDSSMACLRRRIACTSMPPEVEEGGLVLEISGARSLAGFSRFFIISSRSALPDDTTGAALGAMACCAVRSCKTIGLCYEPMRISI